MQCIVYWGPQRPGSGGAQLPRAGPASKIINVLCLIFQKIKWCYQNLNLSIHLYQLCSWQLLAVFARSVEKQNCLEQPCFLHLQNQAIQNSFLKFYCFTENRAFICIFKDDICASLQYTLVINNNA